MRLLLLIALLAACGRDETASTGARAPAAPRIEPAKEFPGLEPFVDSRMWQITGQGQRDIRHVISDLGEMERKLDLVADGEYLPLYVARDGSFLFYFHSW